ncbi:MAG: 50S ribosomal protein L5 [Planctomycetes bacterium]|jgi:large subunit ribosomal protein L5|nr:50S ribosomal protein L5 [Planctomycetota bacterium]
MARLIDKYRQEIRPAMMEKFGYGNRMAVPQLEKIVVSMGVGRAVDNRKVLDLVAKDLSTITGQKALLTRAKTSVSGFKLRQGMPIGCVVTLRGKRMYEFLDRLVSVVIPRIRDFRGLDTEGFDGRGNFNMGLTEQIVFPEIKIDEVEFVQGMNITVVVRRSTDEESLELLRQFGMPFRR